MADRYQGRPFSSGEDEPRFGQPSRPEADSDPLAELARLIGQSDPLAPDPRRSGNHDGVERSAPPSWMQRVSQHGPSDPGYDDEPIAAGPYDHDAYPDGSYTEQPYPDETYGSAVVHPQAYQQNAYAPAQGEAAYHEPLDPSRYDDALYGPQDDAGSAAFGQHPALARGYDPSKDHDEASDPRDARRGGLMTVIAVVALAFVGTAGAYAYRTYVGSPRHGGGDVPIIRADTAPTKVVPSSSDGKAIQDRIPSGQDSERIVSREEQPVDVNAARSGGPRVVFPPLVQNPNPAGVSGGTTMPSGRSPSGVPSGTLGGDEPHKVKTLSIRPDQAELAATPATPSIRPSPRATVAPQPAAAPANAPMSLSPQSAPPPATQPGAPTRIANLATAAPAAAVSAGGYLVQVSSQRSEADAQSSYRSLQGKFPGVLGSRPALIKRADLGDKGVYYRAMVGPFGTPDEASQFCGNLKTAGGQCVVQRN